MLFDNNNVDLDFSFLNLAGFNTDSFNTFNNATNDDRNLFSTKDGFLRGNMFKDEYKPYKNLTYINIVPKNNREAKLFNVMSYSFAINDLNLWLDLHPNDMSKFTLLKKMIAEEKRAKEEFVKEFGPLEICDTTGNSFDWINNPWSWDELRGDIYV